MQAAKVGRSQLADELVAITLQHETLRAAQCTTAGDKYGLTLANISGVQDWLVPSNEPTPLKQKGILIVPCSTH